MTMALLTLAALIGAPLIAGWLGWHVYTGAPWRLPDACRLERAGVALIVAVSVFSGWIDICHKALEAIKP
jgi:hypothetical protein